MRACEEVQGTFALIIDGRGFASKVAAGMDEDFLDSECVSCGACVQACPTATLMEKSVIEAASPSIRPSPPAPIAGSASFKAEMTGHQVVRMIPTRTARPNTAIAATRAASPWGYTNHQDRILKPMIREEITDPWRELSWDEPIGRVASEFKWIQTQHDTGAIGGHHFVPLHQRRDVPRAEAGARGIRQQRCRHLRPRLPIRRPATGSAAPLAPAGTRDFDSVDDADVVMVIGANPTDAHPVFASRMKKRLCQGAKLIVVDPRRTDLVRQRMSSRLII